MDNKIIAFKRTEGKNNSDLSLKDSYNDYKKSSANPVTYKVYSKIHSRCADVEFRKLLEGKTLKLPMSLGTLKLVKNKSRVAEYDENKLNLNAYRVDWKATKLYWVEKYPTLSKEELLAIKNKPVIYHKNEHTDGHTIRLQWDTKNIYLNNKYFRSFSFVRERNIQLKKFLKSEEFKYIEYPDKLKNYERAIK